MTKNESLEIVKAALIEKRDVIEVTCSALEKEAKEEKKAIFEKLFADELVSYADVAVEMGYSGIYFKIGHKEIGSINERSYWRDEDKDRKYYFNTYATMCEDEFEFRRLIFNGKIAERMLNDLDSIKEAFATPYSKKAELAALASEYEILSSEIKQKDYQMQEVRKQDIIGKLNGEGMEWNSDMSFEFNRQWSSYLVKKVRIVKATKSGKTADLEVTYAQYDWGYDDDGNSKKVDKEDRIVMHEGIKMEYVMGNFRKTIYKF
jgi:hypothetical protein